MEIKTVYCFQTGDIALGRSEWNITEKILQPLGMTWISTGYRYNSIFEEVWQGKLSGLG